MAIYGDLEDWVLPDLLATLANRGKSGTLRLTTTAGVITFTFERGVIVAVTSSDETLNIGRFLVKLGFVSEEQIEDGLIIQSLGTAARLGELLVDAGYVTQEQVAAAAAAQLTESLFRLLVQPGGTFAYTPERPPLKPTPVTPFPIEPVVLNAVRLADEWLAAHGHNETVELVPRPIEPETLDGLDVDERVLLLGVLNGATKLHTLAMLTRLTLPAFDAALSRLVALGLVQHRTGSAEA